MSDRLKQLEMQRDAINQRLRAIRKALDAAEKDYGRVLREIDLETRKSGNWTDTSLPMANTAFIKINLTT
jgi:hypothetical protein